MALREAAALSTSCSSYFLQLVSTTAENSIIAPELVRLDKMESKSKASFSFLHFDSFSSSTSTRCSIG